MAVNKRERWFAGTISIWIFVLNLNLKHGNMYLKSEILLLFYFIVENCK